MRRRRRIRCRHRREVKNLARLCSHLRQIDQTVATHPNAVVNRRQVGNDITALLIGDDDLGKLGWEIDALGNNPDAGFWPVRTFDDPADVVAVDRRLVGLLGGRSRRCRFLKPQSTKTFHC